jgi:excisionase family DNA binding protein
MPSPFLICQKRPHEVRASIAVLRKQNMKQLLNAKEVAKLTGLAPDTIYSYAKKGIIPSVRFGDVTRFDPDRLQEWLKEQAVRS